MMKKFWIVMIALIVMGNTVNFTPVIAATTSTTPTSTTASTWLETTMDHNEPFIQEIERQTQKSRANIDQTDLDKLTVLQVSGASEIPDKIDLLSNLTKLEAISGTISTLPNSVGNLKELKILNVAYNNISTFPTIVYQLPKLEELQLNGGTMEEIPTSIVNMASHLKFLGMQNNRLVKVPDIIFTTPWINSNGQDLDLMVSGNQIVTNIPANYVSQFNNGDNMLEFYDNQFQKQDQLTTTAGYTLDVPVGTDFSQLTIDKTSLELKSGRTLLPQHEFEFYDDGSSPLIKNGVATATGAASIYVKSKFSTQTNKFARTLVTVNIIAKSGGDVTVKYEDTNGKELATPIVLNGKDGSTYTSSEKIFPGYTLVATPTNQNGTFTLNPATVNYVYKANDYKLTSTFKDANGKELLPPVVDTNIYKINDTYQTTEANIPGYALVSVPTNQTGTFGAGDITVEYVYKLIDYKLTSTYKDENGKLYIGISPNESNRNVWLWGCHSRVCV
ncbi:MucBP domain-containing protein [Carnobacterium maltaromaticum]|uniref:MucBP domain-containing protein n=1 Tax=Carnobacterium maltaromaticum TaxID=2751 RepID=UPI001C60D54B|nr:MucBP domain-containing protein [Carnobacterium maltaromaticum]